MNLYRRSRLFAHRAAWAPFPAVPWSGFWQLVALALGCVVGLRDSAAERPPVEPSAAELPIVVGRYGQEVALHRERQTGLPSTDVRAVGRDADGSIVASCAQRWHRWKGDRWHASEPPSRPVPTIESMQGIPAGAELRQHAFGAKEFQAAATDQGLYERAGKGEWRRIQIADRLGRLWGEYDVRGTTYDAQGRLWFASPAGVGCRTGDSWTFYEGADGLPYNDFTCCAAGEDGSVWFGTRLGAIRFQGAVWDYRQGPRWLPDDEVRSIAVEPDGTAWLATAAGMGCIARQPMTLAEKAAWYEDEIDKRIKRTRFGYVADAGLDAPGDKTHTHRSDSDNDGLWTAMYGASQCYAFDATRAEISRQRARQAFKALRFLQTVTQGGKHSPPKGYVARTVVEATPPTAEEQGQEGGASAVETNRGPNRGRLEDDRRARSRHDRLWKVYEPRWPLSADGKWFWKSDTSSDELDGHYFFYPLYYDLVAANDAERAEVRQTVCDLTDHLIDHDFTLQDHDGTPTRWGVFRPKDLNGNMDWVSERGLNSLSMLSYLAVAHHVSGDDRYAAIAKDLMEKHHYAANLMVPKHQLGIGSGNQSDDEMAFMSFYNLLKYCPHADARPHFLTSFYRYWMLEQPERNPFFHFAYAAFGRGEKTHDAFAEHDLTPWGDWLEDSIDALKGFPLDRLDWPHKNSHRLDVRLLRQQQRRDLMSPDEVVRGYCVDGKALPVDERYFAHWNTDPYHLDYGGAGRSLASGTVFLLPYYMGRHHGFLAE